MSYYHIFLEAKDHISTIKQTRDVELFNVQDVKMLLQSILMPFQHKKAIQIEQEQIDFVDIVYLKILHTTLPIQLLIEQEQKLLPSDTDVVIGAQEIFHDRELTQDVTQVLFDLAEAI